jgi:hypothetical protein
MQRRRLLAAAAVAGWSKTAAVAPWVLAQPAAAQTGTASPAATCAAPTQTADLVDVSKTATPYVDFDVSSVGPLTSCPGTLFLEASPSAQGPWHVLGSQHTQISPATSFKHADVMSPCSDPFWFYRSVFVSDDHSFKGTGTTHFVGFDPTTGCSTQFRFK